MVVGSFIFKFKICNITRNTSVNDSTQCSGKFALFASNEWKAIKMLYITHIKLRIVNSSIPRIY